MSRLIHSFRNCFHNCRGVAATELALCLPFIVAIFVSSYEMSRFMLLHQRTDKVAYSIADLVTQNNSVTNAQLDQMLLASSQIMKPFTFGTSGVVIISSVYKNGAAATPKVQWRYTGGGTLSRSSLIGNVGDNATLPAGLTLNDKDNVIITEVYYSYTPLMTGSYVGNTARDIYKVAYYKPRLGALTTPPT